MNKAGQKNHEAVVVGVRPERYSEILDALHAGGPDQPTRRRLAAEAYGHTAAYDSWISAYLRGPESPGFPTEISFAGRLAQPLKYGENEHQPAAVYRHGPDPGGMGGARQLQGKELGFNNIQDAASGIQLVTDYSFPAAAIIKHTNPCGLAVADSIAIAYRMAYECDKVSAFGSIVAVNRPLDRDTAEQIVQIVTHVVIAPEVLDESLEVLARRKTMIVLVAEPAKHVLLDYDVRSVSGAFLVQAWDRGGFDRGSGSVPTNRGPPGARWGTPANARYTAREVKANAIVMFKDGSAVGVGAGQMSRVEAGPNAAHRAGDRAQGSVVGSDALRTGQGT